MNLYSNSSTHISCNSYLLGYLLFLFLVFGRYRVDILSNQNYYYWVYYIILHIITISIYITIYRDIFWSMCVEIYLNIRYKYEHAFFWSWMFLFIYILFTSTIHYTSSKYLLNILPLYFSIILYIISISIYITIYRDIFWSKSRSI